MLANFSKVFLASLILTAVSFAHAQASADPIWRIKTLKLKHEVHLNQGGVVIYFQDGHDYASRGDLSEMVNVAAKMDDQRPWCAISTLNGNNRDLPVHDVPVKSVYPDRDRILIQVHDNDFWYIQCNLKTESVKDLAQVFGDTFEFKR